jgi:hypothetical protein
MVLSQSHIMDCKFNGLTMIGTDQSDIPPSQYFFKKIVIQLLPFKYFKSVLVIID